MKKRSLRALVCSLVAVLAVTCGLAVTACSSGQSDEDLIRQDLTANLDIIKNADEDAVQELIADTDTSAFEQLGVDPAEFVATMLDGFDYSIESIAVNGDTATASVTVTCKSMTTMQTDAMDAVYALMDDPTSLEGMSEDELMQLAGQTVLNAVKNSATHETAYEFTYAKDDGTWTIQNDGSEFMNTVFGSSSTAESESDAEAGTSEAEPTPTEDAGATVSQQNALESAQSYLAYSNFSYEGLVDQLEYEGYTSEDATWAVDRCGADWNEQALGSAQDYLDFTAFSYSGLIEQLEFEGFTTEQATYAADSCGADWNEQAALSAQSYLDYSSFSRDELIGQLEFEGFTHEQAVYGVDAVGL